MKATLDVLGWISVGVLGTLVASAFGVALYGLTQHVRDDWQYVTGWLVLLTLVFLALRVLTKGRS